MPAARESLLDAAYKALTTRAWAAVRMVDVAAAAGVSRQTLYNEFGSKEGLARALVSRETERYLQGVERVLRQTGPAPRGRRTEGCRGGPGGGRGGLDAAHRARQPAGQSRADGLLERAPATPARRAAARSPPEAARTARRAVRRAAVAGARRTGRPLLRPGGRGTRAGLAAGGTPRPGRRVRDGGAVDAVLRGRPGGARRRGMAGRAAGPSAMGSPAQARREAETDAVSRLVRGAFARLPGGEAVRPG